MDHNKEFNLADRFKKQFSFINSRWLTFLVTVLLILLIILVFTKVSYVFSPIWLFIKFFSFPVIVSGILYYLFAPIVKYFDKFGISRHVPIIGIFIIIILLITWGVFSLNPILVSQGKSFIENLPTYSQKASELIDNLPFHFEQLVKDGPFKDYIQSFNWESMTARIEEFVTSSFGGLGNLIGSITEAVVGIITVPIILYYLLLEGEKLPESIIKPFPPTYQPHVKRVLIQSNYYIAQYVRSIIILAVLVGFVFGIGYGIIGLDYAVSIAFFAGLLNVVPYLGSIISTVPAIIIALLTSPYMLLKVILVLLIEQLIESRLLQPLIMGSNLGIHPITILFLILGSGRLFGVTGVLLSVPIYAVIKVIVLEIYQAFRKHSDLYPDSL